MISTQVDKAEDVLAILLRSFKDMSLSYTTLRDGESERLRRFDDEFKNVAKLRRAIDRRCLRARDGDERSLCVEKGVDVNKTVKDLQKRRARVPSSGRESTGRVDAAMGLGNRRRVAAAHCRRGYVVDAAATSLVDAASRTGGGRGRAVRTHDGLVRVVRQLVLLSDASWGSGVINQKRAADRRLWSTRPNQPPRNIHVAAAAAPRLVSTAYIHQPVRIRRRGARRGLPRCRVSAEYSRPSRGGAATRLRIMFPWNIQQRPSPRNIQVPPPGQPTIKTIVRP